ncbi:glycosyltransferase family 2 protein [Lactococcus cremoris]|uniref:Glycosyltransferase family 2 protein n=1 Tax=Lactococcus lactis subsp. cremoris TaxID=1359 RepID=A0AAX4AJF5_LACLC|nr:glycosyltransferase family 2 protein [Lactococcus cremoris]KGH34497.1 glycosyl transferase [Lactococcus cremoris]QSE64593.1 glycosyltransferase family 2 protein [Lactococcus cremoris]WMX70295.1 glycosyltransferase family 2 protein [Lactococcus cremoris]
MKTLSIIIPFMGQTEQNLAVALGSINGQIGIDFSEITVHLVNDAGPEIDWDKFSIFGNLDLQYHQLPNNVGPGMARQFGVDHSESRYIMFMDSDDELHFAGALLEFFNAIKDSGDHQILIARYIEQFLDEKGGFRYLVHPIYDWKAAYAKWFSREYLQQENLSFHPELKLFEDTYFVGLSCQLAKDIHYIDSVVYSWLYNENSLVRQNGKSFEHQTALWAKENRLFLRVIREKQQENLKRDLENYVIDVYMRQRKFPPENLADFYVAHLALLIEFSDVWSGYSEDLQAKVDSLRDVAGGQWQGVDTSGFQDFINDP